MRRLRMRMMLYDGDDDGAVLEDEALMEKASMAYK